ncbi:hypothetical protein BKA67DRAFT_659738 [Truncatella angustata]|uniref:Uncharacterized protein n=1 Tax=Truncatella angustata TaxID=152316 RepID=A0A9P8UJ19_9PEZI|nr:uncharacterized protein BKA67DRAFT_659738 [Truncatella angustata]KAH6653097.1 hypothetical protein BKA67DRAFT_659738 [Truncatella angustata]
MTVTNQNTAALALPDPYYIFRALTAFGFYTQWIVMIMNGSFVAMVVTNWHGVFPTGTPVKTAWTGIWPIDFVLGLLVVFFGAVNNVADLTDLGPFLMLVDLVFTLVVFNIMTLVEDRRNRKTGPLRFPAGWQFLWNWCGAASVLPIYSHLYLSKRSAETPSIPAHQRQALVFTAIWSIIISFPVLVPSVLGATPFQVQDGVVMWFFAPLTLGIFQDLFGLLVSKTSYGGLKDPISVAYSIVGAFSAVVHIGVAVSPYFCGPEVTWSRIYWPNHSAPQPGSPSFMTEGAMLFMQYDHVVIYLCVFALGAYMLGFDKITSASSLSGKMQAGYPILVLTAMTVITGPGAGLAWLLCQKEKELRACEEVGDMVEKA